jgi:quercetin dioxygenase-like cupin family protein
MRTLGIQIIKPEIAQPTEGEKEAFINRISNGETDTKGMNISIVRFPRGVRRPWSSHNQDQYVWIISGRGIIISEDKELELNPGNMVFIPANSRHLHGASDNVGMVQLSIIGGNKPRMTSFS